MFMLILPSSDNVHVLSSDSAPKGLIVPARGPANFGWDPIFQPQGFEETYAELDSSVKNVISHRYKALDALREFLLKEVETTPPDLKRSKEN